jgi:hypothetical protein
MKMKITVFWDVMPCSLVKTDRRFRAAYCPAIALMMEAVSTSETSAIISRITRRNIPEDSHPDNYFAVGCSTDTLVWE